MLGKDYPAQDCALARALEVVGERWTPLILRDAFYGVRRFSDFAAHLDIPRAVLSERLRHLVEAGVLERRPDPERPGRDAYELTPSGRELWPALHALMRWGVRFHATPGRTRRFVHAACDVALDERGLCTRCGAAPAPEDVLTFGPGRKPPREDAVSAALQAPRRLLQPLVLDRDPDEQSRTAPR
ncbi:MAG: transcriptional regulator [Streptosporangiales bacterium]|nr:transcriptional regulator [Streptosporangiales bacterium]